MTTLKNITGLTREQNENLYINAVNMLMSFGATEQQAREMVRESYSEAIKESVC